MERRSFLRGALAIFGAAAVGTSLMTSSAEAAPLDPAKIPQPEPEIKDQVEDVAAKAGDELDADGQYYYRRRWRRRVYYRRPRRVYYYRPRRVYYRPRRVYYRRRFFW